MKTVYRSSHNSFSDVFSKRFLSLLLNPVFCIYLLITWVGLSSVSSLHLNILVTMKSAGADNNIPLYCDLLINEPCSLQNLAMEPYSQPQVVVALTYLVIKCYAHTNMMGSSILFMRIL